MAVPRGVKNKADAVGPRQKKIEAEQPGESGKEAIPARFDGKGEEDGDDETEENIEGPERAAEDHAWFIAVDHRPADEIRVGLVSKRICDGIHGD